MGEIRLSKRLLHMPEFADITEADIVRIFGTPEEAARGMQQFRRDHAFLETEGVRSKYPGEYVAALNCTVVAHAAEYRDFRQQLRERGYLQDGASDVAVQKMPAQ